MVSWAERKRMRARWGSWKLQMEKVSQVLLFTHQLNQMIAVFSQPVSLLPSPPCNLLLHSPCLLELFFFINLTILLCVLKTLQWLPTAFRMTSDLLGTALKALRNPAPTPQPSPCAWLSPAE